MKFHDKINQKLNYIFKIEIYEISIYIVKNNENNNLHIDIYIRGVQIHTI